LVEVRAEGYVPTLLRSAVTAIDPDPDTLVARLVRGTLVRGQVVNDAGAPVANARVRWVRHVDHLRYPDAHELTAVRCDAHGRFELADVPTGTIVLAVDHADWPLAIDGPFEVGAQPVERWIELVRGAVIRGRLLDGAGNPLGGETVSVFGIEVAGAQRVWSATTERDGTYELAGLPPGVYQLHWERRRGEVTTHDLLQLVTVQANQALAIDLWPKGRASVRGRIVFDGVLPEVVVVSISPRADPSSANDPSGGQDQTLRLQNGRATFAENGFFQLDFLEAGSHSARVHFAQADGKLVTGGSAMFDVPEEGVVDVVIEAKER
jgi:hypothetical protein